MNHRPKTTTSKNLRLIAATLTLLVATPLIACQIPVFRYALERWQADHYDIVILHENPLTETERSSLTSLKTSNFESPIATNFDIRTLAAKDISDARLQHAWKTRASKNEPLMVVQYPEGTKDVPDRIAMEAPFTDSNVAQIAESPTRKEIAKRLLKGESTVWIFVPSGHKEQDERALKTLKEQVAINESQLELPEQEEIESEEDLLVASHLELRIKFSIITLKRDDPKNNFCLAHFYAVSQTCWNWMNRWHFRCSVADEFSMPSLAKASHLPQSVPYRVSWSDRVRVRSKTRTRVSISCWHATGTTSSLEKTAHDQQKTKSKSQCS